MKIGLFTDTFYPEINGVATSCLNLQRELTRRGHDVHVYAPNCKGWEENQHENVHYLASAPLSTSLLALMPRDLWKSSSLAMATSTYLVSSLITSLASLPYFHRFLR